MPSTSVRLFIFLLGVFSVAQAAKPNFFARRDYNTYGCGGGSDLGPLAIADLNGDGIPDVVCSIILLGNGDGTFRQGPTLQDESTTQVGQSLVMDVNHDGKMDLVFPASSFNNPLLGVGVMLGNGDATFQDPIYYLSAVSDYTILLHGIPLVSGDFNGDGIPDLAELGTSEIIVLLGSSSGAFNPQPPIKLTYAAGQQSITMATADVNGDGRLDLIANADSAIYVLMGTGNATFQSPIVTSTPANAGSSTMAVADLNQDGVPDVALVSLYSSNVLLYPGKRDGTFSSPKTVASIGGTEALVIADINGDGIPDLVTSGVAVVFNKGNWQFQPPVNYQVNLDNFPIFPLIGLADLRHKGRLDVVASFGPISVLLNNGKGRLDDGVLTTVAGGLIVCAATGDFNGDGNPDLAIDTGSAIEIYLGTGKSYAPFRAGATYPIAIGDCPVAGDLNNDGILDLLVPVGFPNSVIALLGNGDGTFAQGPSSAVPSLGLFALADFNGDGILDYATTTNLLALGKGDGSFGPASAYSSYSGLAIAAADLNGDGRPDIVLTDYFAFTVDVFLNNGDGTFQVVLLERAGSVDQIALGDVDGNGTVDLAIDNGFGVSLYLNDGAGNFAAPVVLNDLLAEHGTPVIADVNGDGIIDIAYEGTASAAVFLGRGGGTFFATPFFLGTGNHACGFYALNLHGQNPNRGTPDLIETDTTGLIYTLLNESSSLSATGK